MSMLGGGTEVVVEPTPGGKWKVVKNGFPSGSHNYKDTAVDEARKLAKSESGTLKILKQDMSVQETRNYE